MAKILVLHPNRKMVVYFVCMLFKARWEKDKIFSCISKACLQNMVWTAFWQISMAEYLYVICHLFVRISILHANRYLSLDSLSKVGQTKTLMRVVPTCGAQKSAFNFCTSNLFLNKSGTPSKDCGCAGIKWNTYFVIQYFFLFLSPSA